MAIATAPTDAQANAAQRNAYDVLQERGLVYQCSDEAGLRQQLAAGQISFYHGIDPTADSLHIGHLVGVMAMARLQRCGLRPVALVGGGTTMIGDPTDKTAARRIMTREEIDANAQAIKGQLSRFLDFGPGGAIMVDNAEWLLALNYIAFLRDYGRYFSVNEMLRMETYKTRLETGLSFLEFNYALLQAYDFLELYRRHGCTLQIGGSDQWSNVLAGANLIKRCESAEAYALTWPLVSDASGQKMGKSQASGQVWLDPDKTSPYDYYQHWVNVDDSQVERMLMTYTFLPADEVRALATDPGAGLRRAKETLAFEATTLAHGEDEARKAQASARALFGGASLDEVAESEAVPTVEMPAARLEAGLPAADLLVDAGLADSKGAARRLIDGGGAYLNNERLEQRAVTSADLLQGALLLRAGKKRYVRVVAR
ncbi:MAG: Tyrosyl-tRNA synthetase [uncultured Chloroflexi bacterium]|uniref:Tyrosine--tRNA ligase n=1 Tax=uncultured Chloroflexota bacterium TaxID=166587 RepID=A0A6J4JFE1_9CHLR|nr:MAG: Tyrosyl-tRNA synthetase [uncultured Chloroflexota bacterium]